MNARKALLALATLGLAGTFALTGCSATPVKDESKTTDTATSTPEASEQTVADGCIAYEESLQKFKDQLMQVTDPDLPLEERAQLYKEVSVGYLEAAETISNPEVKELALDTADLMGELAQMMSLPVEEMSKQSTRLLEITNEATETGTELTALCGK